LQVVLALKNNVINFYAGIVSVSLYTILFFQSGLFAESALNFYYLLISVWGIFSWQKNNSDNLISITHCDKKDWQKVLIICIVSMFIIYLVLKHFTNSNVPFWDSLVSALAWSGTWLLIKRKVENWILLNVSNAIAIPLFINKQLELTAFLTLIFFLVATKAYFDWKKKVSLSV
jgi:nicotinamide mononucleotide transporter